MNRVAWRLGSLHRPLRASTFAPLSISSPSSPFLQNVSSLSPSSFSSKSSYPFPSNSRISEFGSKSDLFQWGGRRNYTFELLPETKPLMSREEVDLLHDLEKRVVWLASFMIHNANNVREKRDGLKVGGHQASSSSLSTIMTMLYFKVLQPNDRVAVKPHAGPIFNAINYLYGKQTKENLQNFRGFGGVQSYPSRTKDYPEIDFSTGSVGLGATAALFSSYIHDYLHLKGLPLKLDGKGKGEGKMISLVGDAELDEGSVFESLMESWKLGIRNSWWIIDYNRQSLDGDTKNSTFRLIDRMFALNQWNVVVLKFGKKMQSAFRKPGGKSLRKWINDCENSLYASLSFKGGKAFREQLQKDIGGEEGVASLLSSYSDEELFQVMINLGGHDMDVLLEAFEEARQHDKPTCFIAYTLKGYGSDLAGHRDNHGLLLNVKQISRIQEVLKIPQGEEWEPFAGIDNPQPLKDYVAQAPFNFDFSRNFGPTTEKYAIPDILPCRRIDSKSSTQAGFGQIMVEIGKSKEPFADRVVTMAPDVTTSTNLSGFLNLRGLFSAEVRPDPGKAHNVMSMNKWDASPKGQHIQLGIAENNLFSMLTAAGMSADLFGQRLLPIGTLYDPFISRGLDSLNYGCYVDSRFMVVATPSGVSLGPEGGAHQSIYTPLIGIGQPSLLYYEPAYVDELQVCMAEGLKHMQKEDGGSVYLRLSTRPLEQPQREMTPSLREDLLRGGIWNVPPPPKKKGQKALNVVIVYCGVMAPEAHGALQTVIKNKKSAALLQVTSPDLLYNDWASNGENSYIAELLREVPSTTKIVTVHDSHPAALGWLGSVRGHQVCSLGVTRFGQCGDLVDLYQQYGIDQDAIVKACGI